MLETCKVAQFPFQAGQDVQLADWELYIQVGFEHHGMISTCWVGLEDTLLMQQQGKAWYATTPTREPSTCQHPQRAWEFQACLHQPAMTWPGASLWQQATSL